jgi:hypothetical protein
MVCWCFARRRSRAARVARSALRPARDGHVLMAVCPATPAPCDAVLPNRSLRPLGKDQHPARRYPDGCGWTRYWSALTPRERRLTVAYLSSPRIGSKAAGPVGIPELIGQIPRWRPSQGLHMRRSKRSTSRSALRRKHRRSRSARDSPGPLKWQCGGGMFMTNAPIACRVPHPIERARKPLTHRDCLSRRILRDRIAIFGSNEGQTAWCAGSYEIVYIDPSRAPFGPHRLRRDSGRRVASRAIAPQR